MSPARGSIVTSQLPVTIDYRIDNHRGKRVGANHHTEPVAAAQARRWISNQPMPQSVVDFHPQTSANELRVEVFYRFANIA